MATPVKFNVFTKDLFSGNHSFGSDTFKVMLTNTLPVVTNTVKANITEISAGSGYTAGGETATIAVSTASGVAKLTVTDIVFTSSGTIGPFRYAVLYNDTTSTPAKPLVAWIDAGEEVTLGNAETFTLDFNGTTGFMTL